MGLIAGGKKYVLCVSGALFCLFCLSFLEKHQPRKGELRPSGISVLGILGVYCIAVQNNRDQIEKKKKRKEWEK